jgi:hypothetical protein
MTAAIADVLHIGIDQQARASSYQRGEAGVKLLALVVVLLQQGDAAAQVPAHLARRGLRLAHQNVQQTRFACKVIGMKM